MKVFFCAAALLYTAVASSDDTVPYADLLAEYEAKTGLKWPCDSWPSDTCACHEPSHCMTSYSCDDCNLGCGGNYCFCTECEDGYELQDSACASGHSDECVKIETVSAADSADEHDDSSVSSDGNDARNLPEYNGEVLICTQSR